MRVCSGSARNFAHTLRHNIAKTKLLTIGFDASNDDAVLIPSDARDLRLESGKQGWMGHVPWWFPEPEKYPDVLEFIDNIRSALENSTHFGVNDGEAPLDPGSIGPPGRAFVARLICDRQPAFRNAVLQAYGRKCCITGCAIEKCLEAAHIDRFADSGNDSVTNGILLRADIHRLFDAGLIKVRWSVDKIAIKPHRSILKEYDYLKNSNIRLPKKKIHWPKIS